MKTQLSITITAESSATPSAPFPPSGSAEGVVVNISVTSSDYSGELESLLRARDFQTLAKVFEDAAFNALAAKHAVIFGLDDNPLAIGRLRADLQWTSQNIGRYIVRGVLHYFGELEAAAPLGEPIFDNIVWGGALAADAYKLWFFHNALEIVPTMVNRVDLQSVIEAIAVCLGDLGVPFVVPSGAWHVPQFVEELIHAASGITLVNWHSPVTAKEAA